MATSMQMFWVLRRRRLFPWRFRGYDPEEPRPTAPVGVLQKIFHVLDVPALRAVRSQLGPLMVKRMSVPQARTVLGMLNRIFNYSEAIRNILVPRDEVAGIYDRFPLWGNAKHQGRNGDRNVRTSAAYKSQIAILEGGDEGQRAALRAALATALNTVAEVSEENDAGGSPMTFEYNPLSPLIHGADAEHQLSQEYPRSANPVKMAAFVASSPKQIEEADSQERGPEEAGKHRWPSLTLAAAATSQTHPEKQAAPEEKKDAPPKRGSQVVAKKSLQESIQKVAGAGGGGCRSKTKAKAKNAPATKQDNPKQATATKKVRASDRADSDQEQEASGQEHLLRSGTQSPAGRDQADDDGLAEALRAGQLKDGHDTKATAPKDADAGAVERSRAVEEARDQLLQMMQIGEEADRPRQSSGWRTVTESVELAAEQEQQNVEASAEALTSPPWGEPLDAQKERPEAPAVTGEASQKAAEDDTTEQSSAQKSHQLRAVGPVDQVGAILAYTAPSLGRGRAAVRGAEALRGELPAVPRQPGGGPEEVGGPGRRARLLQDPHRLRDVLPGHPRPVVQESRPVRRSRTMCSTRLVPAS